MTSHGEFAGSTISLRKILIWMFVYWTIAYGAVQAYLHFGGDVASAVEIVGTSILSGLIFAAAMGFTIDIWRRKAGFAEIPTARQSADVSVAKDAGSAARSVVETLRLLNASSVVVSDTSPVLITASTPMTWKSFGERVEVSITPVNQGQSSVSVRTRPKVGTTIIDYGRGLQTVRRIADGLAVA